MKKTILRLIESLVFLFPSSLGSWIWKRTFYKPVGGGTGGGYTAAQPTAEQRQIWNLQSQGMQQSTDLTSALMPYLLAQEGYTVDSPQGAWMHTLQTGETQPPTDNPTSPTDVSYSDQLIRYDNLHSGGVFQNFQRNQRHGDSPPPPEDNISPSPPTPPPPHVNPYANLRQMTPEERFANMSPEDQILYQTEMEGNQRALDALRGDISLPRGIQVQAAQARTAQENALAQQGLTPGSTGYERARAALEGQYQNNLFNFRYQEMGAASQLGQGAGGYLQNERTNSLQRLAAMSGLPSQITGAGSGILPGMAQYQQNRNQAGMADAQADEANTQMMGGLAASGLMAYATYAALAV